MTKRRPTDPNQLAKLIVEQATSQEGAEEQPQVHEKNPAAVALGRLGGLKGGDARAAKLSKQERSEIAKKAAETRWRKKP